MGEILSPLQKRGRLVRAYLKGYPVWCTWQVTYRCNFRCSFCYYWKERPVDEATLEDFHIGSEKLSQLGSLMINLAGGEPLLRKDIPDIVAILSKHHFPMITTNGWMVTRKLARRLWEAGLFGVSVSIDYADPERHDKERGMPGAFERAVYALRYFSEERVKRFQRVNLMAVLKEDNLNDMEGLIRLASIFDAYFMVQPYSPIKTGDMRSLPSPGVSQHLLNLKRRYKNFLSNPYFLKNFDLALNGGVPGCASGRAFFNIDNFGYVAKCVEFRHEPVGRISDLSVEDLLSLLREENRKNTCQGCWYNCRGEIESLYTLRGLLHSLPILLFT